MSTTDPTDLDRRVQHIEDFNQLIEGLSARAQTLADQARDETSRHALGDLVERMDAFDSELIELARRCPGTNHQEQIMSIRSRVLAARNATGAKMA